MGKPLPAEVQTWMKGRGWKPARCPLCNRTAKGRVSEIPHQKDCPKRRKP